MQRIDKTWVIIGYFPTRWDTVLLMYNSLLRTKNDIKGMLLYKAKDGDDKFILEKDVQAIIQNLDFWRRLQFSVDIFKPIAAMTWYVESDIASFLASMGVFILSTIFGLMTCSYTRGISWSKVLRKLSVHVSSVIARSVLE